MGTLTLMGAGPEASGAGTFAAAAMALTPSLYWKQGDPSGTTATDSSGNARNGTYGSGVTLGATSLIARTSDTAATYDNTVNAKTTSAYNPFTGQLTFVNWFNLTNLTGQVSIFGASSNTNAPTLVIANGTGQPIWFSDVAAASQTWLAGDIPAGVTVMTALTWDNATKGSELFVGTAGTLSSKGTKTSVNAFNATPGNFQLGTYGTNTGWRGVMDDALIYPSILTLVQLQALYAAGV